MSNEVSNCKFCQSTHVIKYGTFRGNQYYLCRTCNHKFARTDTIPAMQNSTKEIADVLNMYYEGLSEMSRFATIVTSGSGLSERHPGGRPLAAVGCQTGRGGHPMIAVFCLILIASVMLAALEERLNA